MERREIPLEEQMTDLRQEKLAQIRESLSRAKDLIILEAFSRHGLCSPLEILDNQHRIRHEICHGDGCSTYFLDGVPVLEIYPWGFDSSAYPISKRGCWAEDDTGYNLTAQFKYWIF